MYLWNIVQMLFEFFTVLLMKKFLFKIFFQNKYYEWPRCADFLLFEARGQTREGLDFLSWMSCLVSLDSLEATSWLLCPFREPTVTIGTTWEQHGRRPAAFRACLFLRPGTKLPLGSAIHEELYFTPAETLGVMVVYRLVWGLISS